MAIRAQCKMRGGQMTLEVTGESVKDIFCAIGDAQEIFEAESKCGCCGSKEIYFRHRKSKGYDFYEMVCGGCQARFQFGQAKEGGTLFPKRQGQKGGWSHYAANGDSGGDDL